MLISGLCNNNILVDFDDKMEIRFMDDYLEIERQIGEIVGIASLQYGGEEPVYINKEDIEWEVFPEPVVIEKPKVEGEGEGDGEDNAAQAQVDDDDEANKPPPFDPSKFDWTISN